MLEGLLEVISMLFVKSVESYRLTKRVLKKGFDRGMLPQRRKAIYFFFVQRPSFFRRRDCASRRITA